MPNVKWDEINDLLHLAKACLALLYHTRKNAVEEIDTIAKEIRNVIDRIEEIILEQVDN